MDSFWVVLIEPSPWERWTVDNNQEGFAKGRDESPKMNICQSQMTRTLGSPKITQSASHHSTHLYHLYPHHDRASRISSVWLSCPQGIAFAWRKLQGRMDLEVNFEKPKKEMMGWESGPGVKTLQHESASPARKNQRKLQQILVQLAFFQTVALPLSERAAGLHFHSPLQLSI